jgi:hypothetical protein
MVFSIAAAIVAVLAHRFYRQMPPRYVLLKGREESQSLWESLVGSEQLPRVHEILLATCDAYLLKRSDAWQLRPDDTLRSIYEDAYPPGFGLADTLEHEIMFDTLHKTFGVPEDTIRALWRGEPTLADVVSCCLSKGGSVGPVRPG